MTFKNWLEACDWLETKGINPKVTPARNEYVAQKLVASFVTPQIKARLWAEACILVPPEANPGGIYLNFGDPITSLMKGNY